MKRTSQDFSYLLPTVEMREKATRDLKADELNHKLKGFSHGLTLCEKIIVETKEKFPLKLMLTKVNSSIKNSQSLVLEYEMKYAEKRESFFKRNIAYHSGVLECLEAFKANLTSN